VTSARNVLKTAFIWAVEEAGVVSRNPFDRKGRGKKGKRRRRRPSQNKVAITDQEHELLLAQANKRTKKGFYHLLMFLYRTGARPAEMYLAKAEEWDEQRQAFVIKADDLQNVGRFKLAHLGEDRLVYIPSDLVPLAKELMAKYPDGPLFRTESGEPWSNATLCARFTSSQNAINNRAERQGLPPPIRKEVTAYAYRHAFVTRWVEEGRHLWKLCELLNTSEAMVRQHYSHLFKRTDSLREALDEFDRGRAAQPKTSSPPAASASLSAA
jgi:integrase